MEQPAEYHPKVRDLPAGERPVNRLREVGPTSISTTELLACLLQTPDALHQAQEHLVRFGGHTAAAGLKIEHGLPVDESVNHQ